jgi:hydrogenase maturation protein HypF
MSGFAMCRRCAAEYPDPADRRFHAQPTCCPACGPRLRLQDSAGMALPGEPLAAAAALLRQGQVLAIKGLGGYHLAVDAGNEGAAAALRDRKHREDKPFAIMVAGLAVARELCEVDETAESLLVSSRRPIVLLPRRPGRVVAPAVAPGNRQLGVMLPYTPLHHLLIRLTACPIVLTSGNSSDEPIVYADDEAVARLGSIADAFLAHDRAIHIRTDDSVVRAFRGTAALIRRSRGYVPEPVPLGFRLRRPVLACGAELKNTFCLADSGARSSPSTSVTWRISRRCARSPWASSISGGCSTSPRKWWRTTCTPSTCRRNTPPGWRMWSWPGSSITMRTSRPASPTTASAARSSAWRSTAPATGPKERSGAASSWSRT